MIKIHHLLNSSSCHSTQSTHRQFYPPSECNDHSQLAQSLIITLMILMMTVTIKTLTMTMVVTMNILMSGFDFTVDRIESKRDTHSYTGAYNTHWTQRAGGGKKSSFVHFA